jgi:hypothetical protein
VVVTNVEDELQKRPPKRGPPLGDEMGESGATKKSPIFMVMNQHFLGNYGKLMGIYGYGTSNIDIWVCLKIAN